MWFYIFLISILTFASSFYDGFSLGDQYYSSPWIIPSCIFSLGSFLIVINLISSKFQHDEILIGTKIIVKTRKIFGHIFSKNQKPVNCIVVEKYKRDESDDEKHGAIRVCSKYGDGYFQRIIIAKFITNTDNFISLQKLLNDLEKQFSIEWIQT